MKNNSKFIFIIIGIVILIALIIPIASYFLFSTFMINRSNTVEDQNNQVDYSEYEKELFDNADSEIQEGPLTMSIISPEEDKILSRQARMYMGEIQNRKKYVGNLIECNWKFYMKNNNKYDLYQKLDNRGVVYEENGEICGFTSTFLEQKGIVKVELNIRIYNAVEDLLVTNAERLYTVY